MVLANVKTVFPDFPALELKDPRACRVNFFETTFAKCDSKRQTSLPNTQKNESRSVLRFDMTALIGNSFDEYRKKRKELFEENNLDSVLDEIVALKRRLRTCSRDLAFIKSPRSSYAEELRAMQKELSLLKREKSQKLKASLSGLNESTKNYTKQKAKLGLKNLSNEEANSISEELCQIYSLMQSYRNNLSAIEIDYRTTSTKMEERIDTYQKEMVSRVQALQAEVDRLKAKVELKNRELELYTKSYFSEMERKYSKVMNLITNDPDISNTTLNELQILFPDYKQSSTADSWSLEPMSIDFTLISMIIKDYDCDVTMLELGLQLASIKSTTLVEALSVLCVLRENNSLFYYEKEYSSNAISIVPWTPTMSCNRPLPYARKKKAESNMVSVPA